MPPPWTQDEEQTLIDAAAQGQGPAKIVAKGLLPGRSVGAVSNKSITLRNAGKILTPLGAKWTEGEEQTLINAAAQSLLPQDIVAQNLFPGRSAKSIVNRTAKLRQAGAAIPYRALWTQTDEQIVVDAVASGMCTADIVTGNLLPGRDQRSIEDKIRALRQAGRIAALAILGSSKLPEAPWSQHEEETLIIATAEGYNASDIAMAHVLPGRAARLIAEKVSSLRIARRIPILLPANTVPSQTQYSLQAHYPLPGQSGTPLEGRDASLRPDSRHEQFALGEQENSAASLLQHPQFSSTPLQQPQFFPTPSAIDYGHPQSAPMPQPGNPLAEWSTAEQIILYNAVVNDMTPEIMVQYGILPHRQLIDIQIALGWLGSQ